MFNPRLFAVIDLQLSHKISEVNTAGKHRLTHNCYTDDLSQFDATCFSCDSQIICKQLKYEICKMKLAAFNFYMSLKILYWFHADHLVLTTRSHWPPHADTCWQTCTDHHITLTSQWPHINLLTLTISLTTSLTTSLTSSHWPHTNLLTLTSSQWPPRTDHLTLTTSH